MLDVKIKGRVYGGRKAEFFMTDSSGPVGLKTISDVASDSGDEIDLLALVATLWRGKWWIVLCFALAVLGGGIYAYGVAVPQYRSTATVAYLSSRKEEISGMNAVISDLGQDSATMNTEVEVMQSRKLLGKLVDELKLTDLPEFNPWLREPNPFTPRNAVKFLLGWPLVSPMPGPEGVRTKAIDIAAGKITVSPLRTSYILNVSAITENRQLSADIVNKLTEIYIFDQIETKFAATQQATEWLSNRVAELKVSLEAAEAKVKELDANTELVSPEALAGLRNQVKEMRDRLGETAGQRDALQARLATLEAARDTGDFDQMANLADDRVLARIAETIDLATEEGRTTFLTRYAQITERVVLEIQRANDQLAVLDNSVTTLSRQIETQSADLVNLQQLQREADASRLIYEFFLGRLKEASAQQGIQQAESRVLSEAVPRGAIAPRRTLILALSGVLGLMIGAGLVLGREMMQNTFRTAEELEAATGYTVLSNIPKIPAKQRRDVVQYVLDKPTSALAEAVRNLRTSLLLSNVDTPPQVIMITSSLPGEGKTTQSLVLAQNLSALGKRVLLIEGDVRRQVFTQYFDIRPDASFVSILTGDASLDDAIIHAETLGADILMAEKSKVNAADLFSSSRFADLMKALRSRYDFIIIDTPPVLVVPDARVIGQHADAILYSVHWDKTTKVQVRQGLQMFETIGLKVTGFSMAQIDPKGMKRYGYGKYGAYNAYGAGYYDN